MDDDSTRDKSFTDTYANPSLIGTERGKGKRARPRRFPNARFFATLLTIIVVVSVASHTLIRLFG